MTGILKNKNNYEINPIALHYQFTLHSVVPAPHTIIKGINKLEPGHTLNVNKSGHAYLNKYFDINETELINYKEDEIISNIDVLLNNAVKKRLNIADVPRFTGITVKRILCNVSEFNGSPVVLQPSSLDKK